MPLTLLKLSPVAAMLLFLGCSDSSEDADASTRDSGDSDLSTQIRCPSSSPTPVEDQLGACCYRVANADRKAKAEFRVAGLDFVKPESLGNAVLDSIVATYIDGERFNWIWKLDGADQDGEITVQTGSSTRREDGSFEFASGSGAVPWGPVTFTATLTGESWTGGPVKEPIAVLAYSTTTGLDAELPIREVTVSKALMSDDRNCIGSRGLTIYDTGDGELSGFIRLDDAAKVDVSMGGLSPTPLCMLLLGLPSRDGECEDIPRSEWTYPPDAICDEVGCKDSDCDPQTTCNAWLVHGKFAAQAVKVATGG